MTVRIALPVTLLILWGGKLLPRVREDLLTAAVVVYAALLVAWAWRLRSASWAGIAMGSWEIRALPTGALTGAAALILGGLGYGFSQRVLGLTPPPEASLLAGSTGRLFGGVVLVLAAATLEEWVFRGVLMGALESRPWWVAMSASAGAFAVYHLSLFQLVPTFLLGILLAGLVLVTRSVWPAVVAHCTFNLLGVVLSSIGAGAGRAG